MKYVKRSGHSGGDGRTMGMKGEKRMTYDCASEQMQLKPCPFCGGEATIMQWSRGRVNEMYTASFKCGCNKCNIWFYGKTAFSLENGTPVLKADGYKEACEAWNRRVNNE